MCYDRKSLQKSIGSNLELELSLAELQSQYTNSDGMSTSGSLIDGDTVSRNRVSHWQTTDLNTPRPLI
jgi:hypothetical protein